MTETSAAPDGWELGEDDGFAALVGPIVQQRRPDGLRLFGFRAEARHANLVGVTHGGMLMTLADRGLGVGAWDAADGRPSVTIQFDMQFVSSAKIGEFVELHPELVRLTSSLVFMRGQVRVGDRTVATASGVWKILRS